MKRTFFLNIAFSFIYLKYFRIYTLISLHNSQGVWNKRRRGAKVPELINDEVGINLEGGIFWKKLVHDCNKRGVEGGKI